MALAFNTLLLLPLGQKLADLVKTATERYVMLSAMGTPVDADVLAAFLLEQMNGWDPVVLNRHVLGDDDTREAFARAVGGIAFHLARKP